MAWRGVHWCHLGVTLHSHATCCGLGVLRGPLGGTRGLRALRLDGVVLTVAESAQGTGDRPCVCMVGQDSFSQAAETWKELPCGPLGAEASAVITPPWERKGPFKITLCSEPLRKETLF